jgi:diguanylate cyclase (GGDEF)-like protein/PAS domain S-box-containing protein
MSVAVDAAPTDPNPRTSALVLVAVGSPLRASATSRVIESLGHRVVATVTRSGDLLRKFHATSPDVIVLGLGHSPTEWLDVLGSLREIAQSTPVIASCDGGNRAVVVEAIKLGVSDFFVGLADSERLRSALIGAVKGRLNLRLAREVVITCSMVGSDGGTRWFTAESRDLGPTGMSFWSPQFLGEHQVVSVGLTLPGLGSVSGQVVVVASVDDPYSTPRGCVVRAKWRTIDRPERLYDFLAKELSTIGGGADPGGGPAAPTADPAASAPPAAAGSSPVASDAPTLASVTDTGASDSAVAAVIEAFPEAVAIVDAERRIRHVNRRLCQLSGFDAAELLGTSIDTLLPRRPPSRTQSQGAEESLERKDGHSPLVEVTESPVAPGGPAVAIWVFRDRSDRIMAARREQEHAELLMSSEQRFQDLYSRTVVGMLRSNGSGRLIAANPIAAATLGYDSVEQLLREVPETRSFFADPADRNLFYEQMAATGEVRGLEYRALRRDGSDIWVEAHAYSRRNALGAIISVDTMALDVTARRSATLRFELAVEILGLVVQATPVEKILQRLTRMLDDLLPGARAAVLRADDDSMVQHDGVTPCPPGALRRMIEAGGVTTASATGPIVGGGDLVVRSYDAQHPTWAAMADSAMEPGMRSWWSVDIREEASDHILGLLAVVQPHERGPRPHEIELLRFAGNLAAIAVQRARVSAELHHRANHDVLTGLPNRSWLVERIEEVDLDDGTPVLSVILIDVDGAQTVDRMLGHRWTDDLTLRVADCLTRDLGDDGVLTRYEGLSFVVVCRSSDGAEAEVLARRLVRSFQPPFHLDDRTLYLSARAGVVVTPRPASSGTVLRDAAVALEHTTRGGDVSGRVVCFDDGLRRADVARLRDVDVLRNAIGAGDFELHMEPVMWLGDDRLLGARALAYWRHPDGDLRAPGEYAQLVQDSGLAVPMWAMTLRAACSQMQSWQHSLPTPPSYVAVKLSAHDLGDPGTIAEVRATLGQWQLGSGRLVIELNESFVLESSEPARQALRDLHSLGVTITIDDFGGGRSALAQVRDLPIAAVTLDAGLTASLVENERNQSVAAAIVHLAHALGLVAAAFDVRSEAQRAALVSIGCDAGQGSLWADPMTVPLFEQWMASVRVATAGAQQ